METEALEKLYGRGVNFQIEVEKIQPITESLKKACYLLFIEPKENWYKQDDKLIGVKEFLVKDPDGYLLRFAGNLGTKKSGK